MLEMRLFSEDLRCPRWRGDRNSLERAFKFCVLSCMQMCSVCSSAQRNHCEVRYSLLLATIPHHGERWVGWLKPMARMASKPLLPPSGSGLASSALCLSIPVLSLALFSILLARCDLAVFCSLDAALLSQHAKFIIVYASWQPEANGDHVCVRIYVGMQQ